MALKNRKAQKNLLASAAAVAALTLGPQASAAVFDFSYSAPNIAGTGFDTASGEFTANLSSGDVYLLTDISGVYNGNAITELLPPGSCCTTAPNDNLIFPNNDQNGNPGTGFLDINGIAFVAGTTHANLYDCTGTTCSPVGYSDWVGSAAVSSDGTFTLTLVPEAVGEPITLSLVGAGLVGAAAMRRRKKKPAYATLLRGA